MASSNTVYANVVLESKLTDLLNTKINARNLMKVDTDLAQSAGMKKTINVYTYTTGTVEDLAVTESNQTRGVITFTPVSYDVVTSQEVFDYYDEDFMQDPKVLDMGMEGASTLMVNDLNTKFFAQLALASLEQKRAYNAEITYDEIVDGISLMNLEDESNLVVIIGTGLKAEIRKDTDFTTAQLGQIIFNGQIGSIAGIPVVVSKLVPAHVAYIVDKSAVTLFIKKESEVEQVRTAETRKNTVVMRKVALVALTDATKLVACLRYITTPVITTSTLAAGTEKTFAGTCVAGATIRITVDGVAIAGAAGLATVTGTDWTYTIATVTQGKEYSIIASKAGLADKAAAAGITAGA